MDTTNGYFLSRSDAGQQLAKKLEDLRYKNTAILALSPGSVVIAIEIAKQLRSVVGLLLLKHIYLPDGKTAIGIVNDHGGFTYDQSISVAQLEDFNMEYRNIIEINKMNAMHELHTIGQQSLLTPHYCMGRTVIVINDIAKTGTAFRAALDFLKPIKTEEIVLVSAVAREPAYELMRKEGDRAIVEHITDKEFPPEHYFANNEIPKTKELIDLMEQIILQW